jgi:hypothetical protein
VWHTLTIVHGRFFDVKAGKRSESEEYASATSVNFLERNMY